MSLDGSLLVASSGIADINSALGVLSQNIANVSTPDYSEEVANRTSVTAGGNGLGVATGPTTRDIDAQLQTDVLLQKSAVAGLATQQNALQTIDAVQGAPGGTGDLASLVGSLQDAFTSLQTDPSNQAGQAQVVTAASQLAGQINALSKAYTTGRQNAQDSIVTEVASANKALGTIGTLSAQIVALKAGGQSTADLEIQRDQQIDTLSQLIQVKTQEQPDGDLIVLTPSGLNLPIHGTTSPLATAAANLAPGSYYPATVPPITLNGVDVTAQIAGGQIGANVALRDQTLPTYQASLDSFAYTLTTQFSQQGLTLFSNPTGAVPAASGTPVQSGYIGYSATITVNPAVTASPSAVVTGTPDTSGGLAGYTGTITAVLDNTFGAIAAPLPTSGLGPGGTLAAAFSPPQDLATFASDVVGAEASDSAAASSALSTEQAVQTSLQAKLSTGSAVSIDSEMSTLVQLQNAYGANAKVITAVQSMWSQLLQMVG
jgi:flagellar hook-associated protein 1 FlgK